jgi:hypothetical protein
MTKTLVVLRDRHRGRETERERERVVHYKRVRKKRPQVPFLFPSFASSSSFTHPFIFTKYNPFFLCIRHAFIHHQPPEKSQRRAKTRQKAKKRQMQ